MKNKGKKKREALGAVPFMLPSFLGMIVFSLLPIVVSIIMSFTDWDGLEKLNLNTLVSHFVGLDNYAQILGGKEFWAVLGHKIGRASCRERVSIRV